MKKIVVVGGGFAGTAAAVAAKEAGANVTLVERTDGLLGTGQHGGKTRENARFTFAEEMIAMGGGKPFQMVDECKLGNVRRIEAVGSEQVVTTSHFFDLFKAETAFRNALQSDGAEVLFRSRAVDVEMQGKRIKSVKLQNGEKLEGDAFIDATGGAGGIGNCKKYGKGCALCSLRCPVFGDRVSIAGKAGVEEVAFMKKAGEPGVYSNCNRLHPESIGPEIKERFIKEGVTSILVPVPKHLQKKLEESRDLASTTSTPEMLKSVRENLYLEWLPGYFEYAYTGPFWLPEYREIPGLENATVSHPYAGGIQNSVRFLAIIKNSDDTLKTHDIDNLFGAGEKVGYVGHAEAQFTGVIAGHNAARLAAGKDMVKLPRTTAVGEAIAYAREELLGGKPHIGGGFAGARGPLFGRLRDLGLFTTDVKKIKERIDKLHLTGILAWKMN